MDTMRLMSSTSFSPDAERYREDKLPSEIGPRQKFDANFGTSTHCAFFIPRTGGDRRRC